MRRSPYPSATVCPSVSEVRSRKPPSDAAICRNIGYKLAVANGTYTAILPDFYVRSRLSGEALQLIEL